MFSIMSRHRMNSQPGHSFSNGILWVRLILLTTLLATGVLQAQTSNGTITGLVTDSQKLLVVGAQVTITGKDGTVKRKATTTKEGVYSVPSIPPGIYTVLVTAKGFGRYQLAEVSVTEGGIAEADAILTPGSTSETVTVMSSELLSPASATLATTVEQTTLVELPFPERNVLAAVLFAPGVTGDPQTNDGIGSELPNAYNGAIAPGSGLTIGGSREGSNPQLVDGSDLTLAGYPRTGVTFSGDAIRSVTVLSVGLAAQYGRSGGGVINQGSKAGTNRYHGALRWRHRDPLFELVAPNSGGAAPAEHLNLFTISLGGPIPLPYWKGRTFFQATFEPLRDTNATYIRKRFFTPDELAGRFHNSYDLLNTTILKNQGYAAAVAAPRVGGVFFQYALNAQGFPIGNRLASTAQYVHAPNDNISGEAVQNPITSALLASQPTPGNPTKFGHFIYSDGHYDPDGLNGFGIRGSTVSDNRYNFRIDENLTSRDSIFFRYTSVPVSGLRYDYAGLNSPTETVAAESINAQNVAVNYVRVVSPKIVNEFRATFLHSNDKISPTPAALTQDFGAAIGLPSAIYGAGLAAFNFSNNLTPLGQGGNFGNIVNENYGFGDDISYFQGRHSIKFGMDYRAIQLNRFDQTNLYGGSFTCNTSLLTGPGATTSSCLAGYMLGLFNTYTVNTPHNYDYRWKYGAAYIQDDWRPLSRLTVNIGLRYNVETPRMEKNNYQGSFVSTGTGTLNGVSATGGFAFAGTNGLHTTLWPINFKGLEPRIGISYQPQKFMTIRAAYTLMHTPLTGLGVNIVPNLTTAATTVGSNGVGGKNPGSWVNLITNPISTATPTAPPAVSSNLQETWNGTTYLPMVNQSSSVPYVQLWSLSTQVQLSKRTVVEADYVGQKGTHLYSTPVPVNDPPIAVLQTEIANRANFNVVSTDQFGNKTTLLQQLRPYPQFNTNPIFTAFDRKASSSYNALYLTARQQASYGLTLFATFSWSKSIDNASSGLGGPGDTQFDVYGYLYPQGYSTANDVSLSAFDIPVHLSIGDVWAIPVGRGKKFFATAPRWVDSFIGGWTLSNTTNMQSGYPLSVVAGVNGTSAGYFCSTSSSTGTACDNGTALADVRLRPNRVAGVPLFKPNWKKDPFGTTSTGGILNPAAFSMAGSLNDPQFGNVRRTLGDARNPRSIISNASLRKRVDIIPKKVNLQLWADFVNVLNHENYFISNNNPAIHGVFSSILADGSGFAQNPQFGNANAVAPGPRQINLGIALEF